MKLNHFIFLFAAVAASILPAAVRAGEAKGGPAKGGPSVEAPVGKSGAQLWAENCQRCHNFRSPTSYSPAQWEVAMLHMRVRANLTPEQHTKILAFLKSGT